MLNNHSFLSNSIFGLDAVSKSKLLTERLNELSLHHYNHCAGYKKILDAMNFNVGSSVEYHNIPFLPVGLFKQHDLSSIEKSEIIICQLKIYE